MDGVLAEFGDEEAGFSDGESDWLLEAPAAGVGDDADVLGVVMVSLRREPREKYSKNTTENKRENTQTRTRSRRAR